MYSLMVVLILVNKLQVVWIMRTICLPTPKLLYYDIILETYNLIMQDNFPNMFFYVVSLTCPRIINTSIEIKKILSFQKVNIKMALRIAWTLNMTVLNYKWHISASQISFLVNSKRKYSNDIIVIISIKGVINILRSPEFESQLTLKLFSWNI